MYFPEDRKNPDDAESTGAKHGGGSGQGRMAGTAQYTGWNLIQAADRLKKQNV